MAWNFYDSNGNLLQSPPIADNQITLALMAGITRGSIIYGDASGDPAALAKGTSDQVLTSDGTDVSWEDAPSQANQAAIEGETNENTYIPPDLLKHAPGIAKVWVSWEQVGTHAIESSYNMTSLTDAGLGRTAHTFATDFSSATYAVVLGGTEGTVGTSYSNYHSYYSQAEGTISVGNFSAWTLPYGTAALIDSTGISMACFGDQ